MEDDELCVAGEFDFPPFSSVTASTITSTATITPPTIRAVARPAERSGLKYFGPLELSGEPGGRVEAPPPATAAAVLATFAPRGEGERGCEPPAAGPATVREGVRRAAATGAGEGDVEGAD